MTDVFVSIGQKENFWPGTYTLDIDQMLSLGSSKELRIRLKPKTMAIDSIVVICVNRQFLWTLIKGFIQIQFSEIKRKLRHL